MRIPPFLFGSLVLVVFLGTIFGFQTAGVWSVSGKVDSAGQAVQPSADDVESIKGWMTLEQITSVYNVPLADLLAHFNLPADTPAATEVKDLESEEFSVEDLRTWLQNPVQDTLQDPETSVQQPEPTSTAQVILTPTAEADQVTAEPTPLPTEHISPEKTVNAKTTFQDLLDWGVPEEVIVRIIGGELPALSTVIKNYCTGKGLEFSPTKTALQAEVDKIR